MDEKEKVGISKQSFLPAEASVISFAKDSVIATSGNGFETGAENIDVPGGETKPWNW